MAKVSLGTSRKERYRNHDCYDWKLSSLGMFDFIGIPISARSWAGERGERQEEMQKGVTENVCCVNDAETLWRNLGQHRGTKTINFSFFFFPPVPSHRSSNLSSLIYRILFSPNRHRPFLILFFLSFSFSFSPLVNEKDRILRSFWMILSKEKEFRIDRTVRILFLPKSGE